MINPNERRSNMKFSKPIIGVLVMAIAAFAFQDASITRDLQPIPPSILSSGFEGSDFTAPPGINHDVPDITICCAAYPEQTVSENPSPELEPQAESQEPANPAGTIQATEEEPSNRYFCGKTICYKV
jgi:hypothetical protein